MRRVIRRALGAGVLALLLAAAVAMAAAPQGPRLAVIAVSGKPTRLELLTVNPNGGRPVHLAGGGPRSRPQMNFLSPLSWSPDGTTVAFSGIVGFQKSDDHEPLLRLFTVGEDGSGLQVIRGTNGATGPVFAPDGRTLAFTRSIDRETPTRVGGKPRKEGFHGASIWTVDLLSGAQRQLTPWREGVKYAASSFSPDGTTLLATHEDTGLLNEPEPVALKLDGSGSSRLLEDGGSPVYSPDGSKIALVRRVPASDGSYEAISDIYVVNADGSGARRITHTARGGELLPSWDPSGERLTYLEFRAVGSEGLAFRLMQINADGSCPTKLRSAPRTFLIVSAWQPGPGRGAGRIAC